MFSIEILIALVTVSYYAHGLKVNDVFPQHLISEAEIGPRHEDFGLDINQFLEKYGYPIETHEVVTEDGYILTMHRIPHGRNEIGLSDNKKPAVLLMHGLLCSSMDWVYTGADSSLGLMLADVGYDVWIGNNRGNTWSRKHTSLNPDADKEFWDFSFEDCGIYDLPAKIDYILNKTGNEKINYVGHSQGSTQFFALASLKPEYNSKINLMTALAPVSYMGNFVQPLIKLLSNYVSLVEMVLNQLKWYELLPSSPELTQIIKVLCRDSSPFQELCVDVIFFIAGEDSAQFNRSFLEVIGTSTPAGMSTKMMIHYMQEIHSGYFRRYDYGLGNLAIYKKLSPPSFDVSLITVPVALFYGQNDLLSGVPDVERLASELPNVVENKMIEYELFNHLDFLWAIDLKTLVNDDVVALLNKYNSGS